MMTKLVRHGESLALVLDERVLDSLKVDADTPLEITTDGDRLIVTPQRLPQDREKFLASLDKMSVRYDRMLKRLAE